MSFTQLCLAVSTLSSLAALGLSGQTAWADSTCIPPANGPTGPGAATFTYQCAGTYTGDWTNTYYVYDPSTGTQTALYSPNYTYDCTTNTWTQTEWDYDTATGAYVEDQVPATTTPNQPTNCATITGSNTTDSSANSGTAASTTNTPATAPSASGTDPASTPANTVAPTAPPDPSNTCATPSAAGATPSNTDSGVALNNNVCSTSQTGDASVTKNGSAGNATSGNATTEVNIANLVQTLNNVLGAGTLTFTSTITGDVTKNIILDPSAILALKDTAGGSDGVSDVTTDAGITNNIYATAATGNATVSGNGDAGNATTGNAEAIINLINMINSAVSAGQSFIGTINIEGDLNGNILIPQSVIDQILAYQNAASSEANGTSGLNNNESITNNVDANAATGSATVADNYNGGNATSGNASTNVAIMNLTGSSVIGKNVLLVFVNVLGQWVGMIVNAPAGATSAEFGGGITSDTPATTASAVDANANLSITNNVYADATTGNALVSQNHNGGNATSGNASTAVNILNMEDSNLSLANWFGILFINVFGTWNGNFGILPTPIVAAAPSTPVDSPAPSDQQTSSVSGQSDHFASFITTNSDEDNSTASNGAAVLGDTTAMPTASKIASAVIPTTESGSHNDYILPVAGFCLAALFILFAERDRFIKHKG